MMFMSSHIYSDLEFHARFWVFTAEAAPAKPPEHKITVKELAAFVLQDADNIVKNSKWSVNDNSMYIFTWIGLHREIVNWWNELQFNLSNINTCTPKKYFVWFIWDGFCLKTLKNIRIFTSKIHIFDLNIYYFAFLIKKNN